jgi:hypothetical protein
MSLTTELREKLLKTSITMDRFREIATRLLSYGVLVRDEDRTEMGLYDETRQVDINAQFFRLYAPGAVVDGLPEDTFSPVPSLKARVSTDFVATAIALRFLYQEKLNQGLIDTQAEALISFDDLALTLQSQLKRQLPERDGERMALLAELKRHRLLRYSSTFSVSDEDAYLAIRPTILGVISNEALAVAMDADGEIEPVVQFEEPQE